VVNINFVSLSIFIILILPLAISHAPYPGAKTDYCYDQELEGKLCFENHKMCEKMQSDDQLARGYCHKDS